MQRPCRWALAAAILACSTSCTDDSERSPTKGPPAEALIRGFQVVEVSLGTSQREPLLFSITAPPSSRYVSCGLFIAPPSIDPDRKRIQTCPLNPSSLWLQKTLRVADGSQSSADRTFEFGLDSFSPLPGATDEAALDPCWGSICNLSEYRDCPVVSRLQVGCWVTSHDGVIAATELRDVAAKDLPGVKLPVESCQSGETETTVIPDGQSCTIRTGHCENGECVGSTQSPDPAFERTTADAFLESCQDMEDEQPCVASAIGTCVMGKCVKRSGKLSSVPTPLVVAECIQSSDFLNCEGSPDGTIGTCVRSSCLARCKEKQDCDATAVALGLGTNDMDCYPVETQNRHACAKTSRALAEGAAGLCFRKDTEAACP